MRFLQTPGPFSRRALWVAEHALQSKPQACVLKRAVFQIAANMEGPVFFHGVTPQGPHNLVRVPE